MEPTKGKPDYYLMRLIPEYLTLIGECLEDCSLKSNEISDIEKATLAIEARLSLALQKELQPDMELVNVARELLYLISIVPSATVLFANNLEARATFERAKAAISAATGAPQGAIAP